jgi:hypothetical protein
MPPVDAHCTIRLPKSLAGTLKHVAARHGRRNSETGRLALELYVTEAILELLESDRAFRTAIQDEQPKIDLDSYRRQTAELLRQRRVEAFRLYPAALERYAELITTDGEGGTVVTPEAFPDRRGHPPDGRGHKRRPVGRR